MPLDSSLFSARGFSERQRDCGCQVEVPMTMTMTWCRKPVGRRIVSPTRRDFVDFLLSTSSHTQERDTMTMLSVMDGNGVCPTHYLLHKEDCTVGSRRHSALTPIPLALVPSIYPSKIHICIQHQPLKPFPSSHGPIPTTNCDWSDWEARRSLDLCFARAAFSAF